MRFIGEAEQTNIYSFDHIVEHFPHIRGLVKDIALKEAKRKLETQTQGLDKIEHNTSKLQFSRFNKGLELIIPLINALGAATLARDVLVEAVIDTFKTAVASQGFIFDKFHDGERKLDQFVVKDAIDKGGGVEVAYIHLHVTARKIGGWFKDSSETTVTYTFKLIKFRDLDSMVHWLSPKAS
jgi:hypothetical protein